MFSGNEITDIDRMYNCTCKLREEERIDVPDWAAGKVVYQIFLQDMLQQSMYRRMSGIKHQ